PGVRRRRRPTRSCAPARGHDPRPAPCPGTGWDEADRLSTVAPGHLDRYPDLVAQIAGCLELQFAQAREWHPRVTAVDDDFQARTDARIRVGDPFERVSVDGSGHCRRLLERLLAQSGGLLVLSRGTQLESLQQERQPL